MVSRHSLLVWLLTRGRLPVLIGLLAVTLLAAVAASRLQVEAGTASMVSRQPEQQAAYQQLQQLFGNDDELLLSVSRARLLEPDGVALLDELTRQLEAIDGVRRVLSLSTAEQLVPGRYGAEAVPLLPNRSADDFRALSEAALQANPHYQGLLFSADRRTAGLLIELNEQQSAVGQRRQVIDAIRALMSSLAGQAELHLTGVGVQQSDVAEYIQRDQEVVLPLVVAVLVVMLSLIFRRPSGVILPLLATLVSLVWTLGLYAACGFELNTLTSLLPPVVMVLAVSNSVHIYNGWLHLDGADSQRIAELAAKLGELLIPCLFTALTTACGLVSLVLSAVPAVQQFALFAAFGVLISLLVSLTLVPIGLTFLPLPERHWRTGTGLLRWILQNTAQLSCRAPRALLATALLVTVLALLGLPQLQNNTDLVGFLRDDAPLAIDTRFIDQQLAGVNSLEFMLSRADGQPLASPEDYSRLAAFERLVQQQQPVANVYSILLPLRQLQWAENSDAEQELPAQVDELRYLLELLSLAPDQSLVGKFISADRQTARINIRLHRIGSRAAAALVDTLQTQGEANFGSGYRLTATGSYLRMVEDSNRLVADLVKSFSLSLLLIMLTILLLLRSLRLTLLAMLPNVIPILVTFGLMGYFAIDLSTGTAMIGAVAIGLAVDDTIHYLVHYRRCYAGDAGHAVQVTTTRTGRALMISTLILACGFWAGCLGSFKPTIYFSFLVGGTLFAALACDLLLLPACLVLGDRSPRELST